MNYKYRINEIFYSIQGEGFNTGIAAIFIRFSGCNLNCNFCDTNHNSFIEMELEQILDKIKKFPSKNIILTGGEPTIQNNLQTLIDKLKKNNYNIFLETNGTNSIPKNIDWVTVSPKTNDFISKGNELKLIYINQSEEELKKYLNLDFDYFYLQPVSNKKIIDICEIIKKNPKWRLSVQLHKLIGIK